MLWVIASDSPGFTENAYSEQSPSIRHLNRMWDFSITLKLIEKHSMILEHGLHTRALPVSPFSGILTRSPFQTPVAPSRKGTLLLSSFEHIQPTPPLACWSWRLVKSALPFVWGHTEQMVMTAGTPGNEQMPHIRVPGSCHLARNDSLSVWQQP